MLYTAGDLLLHRAGDSVPVKVAIVDGERRVSYAELVERSFGYAALLRESNIERGDRVCIFLQRSVEAVAALFATWFAGGVAVVLNENLRARQVQYILEHSEATCLITDSGQLRQAGGAATGSVKVIDLNEAPPAASPWNPARLVGSDLALIIYTSGSTGMPKGVMVSHDNLLSGVRTVSDYLNLGPSDLILSVLPFSFDYGLNQLLTALAAGGTLVIQRSLFPPEICKTLHRERITGLAGVPMFWLQLTARHSPFLTWTFPNLRYVTNSGGTLPERTVRSVRSAHPHLQIYLMYGLTEAFRSTYLPPAEVDRRPSSIGRAIPNVEVLVINSEGEACQPGEIGELIHRGANVSMGYWRDPESTAQVFRPHPFRNFGNGREEVVVFSGDLVRMDGEGYLYYAGRKDQLIKSRGFRVSPEEIECCLTASNLVSNAVAFAVQADGGESDIGVAVIPAEPAVFREETLIDFCRREMPEYMRPRAIWRMQEFPLTTTGKADRQKIREMFCTTL